MKIKTPASRKPVPTAKAVRPSTAQGFTKGQKWQLATGHAEIIHIGKTLVQFRFIKTGMVRGPLEMKSIPHFAEALKAHKAKLIA